MASILQTYDNGLKALLYSRFKTILGIEDIAMKFGVIQCPEEIALREFAERRGDNWLDFISFYRTTQSPSWGRQRTVLARRGVWLDATTKVTAQPIDLTYFVTFWSKDIDKINLLIEKYVLWQHDNPKLLLAYGDYTIDPDLHFGEIIDESTYGEKYQTGSIFANRVPIKVDGWVLESETATGEIEKIRLTVYDKDEVTDYDSIVVEDSGQDTEAETVLRLLRRRIYEIEAVDALENSITIEGEHASDFSAADIVVIQNSTDSNGLYTLSSATEISGDTKLIFEVDTGTVIGLTADGVAYKDV